MKMNKKGFTIVELVIVIAVIAILAGVMIPTFGGVIDNAKATTAQQEAANVYKLMSSDVNNVNKGKEFTEAEFVIVLVEANGTQTYTCKVVDGEVQKAEKYVDATVVEGYTNNKTTVEGKDTYKFGGPYNGAEVYYKLAD